MPITEDQAERAVDYIRDNAGVAAEAKATRLYLVEYRKSLKSILMGDRLEDPLGAQERYAYSHEKYLEHLNAMRLSIYEDERLQWMMLAADKKIGLYQSQIKGRL